MPLTELSRVASQDYNANVLRTEYRRQWYAFRALDRLEAALTSARKRAISRPAVAAH